MLKLRVTNSASGLGTEKILDGNTTIAQVMDMPEFASYFTGQNVMLNGSTLLEADWSKSLLELGASTTAPNVLTSVKAANGAC